MRGGWFASGLAGLDDVHVRRNGWIVTALVLALLGLGAVLLRSDGPQVAQESQTATPEIADSDPANDAVQPRAPEEAADGRAEVQPADAHLDAQIRLRGRVVTAGELRPIEGATVFVNGHAPGNNEDRVPFGEPQFENPPMQRTAADGQFEFVVPRLAGHRISLHVMASLRVARSIEFEGAQLRTLEELGDVALTTGTELRGRVLDTKGQPCPGVRVSVHTGQGTQNVWTERSWKHFIADAAGSLLEDPADWNPAAMRFPAGEHSISVVNAFLASPPVFTIPVPAPAVHSFEVVVEPIADSHRLKGIVVDERGAPVPDAAVLARAAKPSAGPPIQVLGGETDERGVFELLVRRAEAGAEYRLQAQKPGYDLADAAEPVRLDGSSPTLVMRRALEFELLVLDRDTNAPVEHYGVLCARDAPGGYAELREQRRRKLAPPIGGVLRLTEVRRGWNTLLIELPKQDWPAAVHRFFADDGTARRLVVHTAGRVTQELRVQDSAGRPVAGIPFRLEWNTRPEVGSADKPVRQLGRFSLPLRVATGHTDQRGDVMLEGPADVPLLLSLPGPGHLPFEPIEVRLARSADPLVVTVQRGGSIRGSIGPPEFVAFIGACGKEPGVRLVRRTEERSWVVPADADGFPIAADGSFQGEGLAEGEWDAKLIWWPQIGRNIVWDLATGVRIRDGAVATVTQSFAAQLPGTLSLQIVRDGVPAAAQQFELARIARGPDGMVAFLDPGPVGTTDADGRWSGPVVPGTYEARLVMRTELPERNVWLPIQDYAQIATGQSTQWTITHASHRLRVELRDEQGRPRAGVQIGLATPVHAFSPRFTTGLTAADGSIEFDVLPVGRVHVLLGPSEQWLHRDWAQLGAIELPAVRVTRRASFVLKE